ncbi:hypothetical protein MSG28_004457 [Choristoneura fumiferana]|uniref:Uncharacterized protein n=1 Tax=Choristoneura fumiferana TaxID=7141 RepID=A0ACC0K691_CHOFU|nr:hypothetical protein MSG28_004457 [Choristoneura fumiferana]
MEPPSVFAYLNSMFKDVDVGYYPYLTDVNTMSKDLIEILNIVGNGRNCGVHTISRRDNMASSTPRTRRGNTHYQAVLTMCERGITPRDIDNLPPALGLVLLSICAKCKGSPPAGWPGPAYALAMREELLPLSVAPNHEYMESQALEVLEKETAYSLNRNPIEEPVQSKNEDSDTNTGMEHLNTKLLSLLYPRDHRMAEVLNLLQSSIPVTIELTQRPEVSDHDFIEEQEKQLFSISTRTMALPVASVHKQLFSISTRTMALPVARGMVTLRSLPCAPTEPLSLPKLCVSGRAPPPRANTITLGGADTSPHCLLWPTFHNGVAAGLALVPMTGTSIDSSWVVFNKPRGTQEMSTEHAGFLMALGLNGHLRDMPFMNIYEYLVRCNEMISVGLLLGIAATYRGTMDLQATKMMSIHLEALLPPSHVELDIQHGILVCALLGLGLVYQDTRHAHLAQVLLMEIGQYGTYSTGQAAGPRAGVLRGAGRLRPGGRAGAGAGDGGRGAAGGGPASHHALALRTYMLGGERGARPPTGVQRDKYKHSSYAIREGSNVNLDVTSPGATLALGLIYLRSNNEAIASWLAPPTTAYLLDFVRPDLLMLRIIARGLIMWDSIEASEEWIESQVPSTIRPYCFVKPTDENVDYEAMNQAYCNIIAGACFALGLRFAGSGDEDARDAALHYTKLLLAVRGKSIAELAGRSTLEACLCVCLLSAGMIMCGRGDIAVLRYCRRLRARGRAPPRASPPPALPHGAQMAIHCTIGLLFLGGGRATLSTSATSIGALVAAFFPKFPTHSEDNRYHLQAFRHLYVLAVEPRLILPRDLSTGKLCYAHLQVIDLAGAVTEMKAPCIIPELNTLREVRISDPRYWPITFQRDRNWDQLKTFLEYTWCIDIKQRAGCLSYLDDPQGFLTILAQSLTLDKTNIWSVIPDNIELFTNDDRIKNFVRHYLAKESTGAICADCLLITKKRKGLKNEGLCRSNNKNNEDQPLDVSHMASEATPCPNRSAQPPLHKRHDSRRARPNEPLMSSEFTLSIKQKVANIFDSWEQKITPYLRKYLGLPGTRKISNTDEDVKKILSCFLIYHDLPRNVLKNVDGDCELGCILALESLALSAEALHKIQTLVR